MNPQQYFGFASIPKRQDRGLSSNDPSSNRPTVAEIQAALSLREEQANLNHLFNQPMRQHNIGLATGLPAIDIATLQHTLAIEEGNRRRMSLQAQLDLLSRSSGGFTGTRLHNIDLTSLHSKSGLGLQQHNTTENSGSKRRKLSMGAYESRKYVDSNTEKSRSSKPLPSVVKQKFPLPPSRDGGACLLRDNLTSFRIAWEALNKTCESDDGMSNRERELLVKETFGKTIHFDKVLLYHLAKEKSR